MKMNLQQWLIKEGRTIQHFADEVGVDRTYISKVITGHVHPSLAVALDLRDAVRGEVPLEYFLPRALRPTAGLPKKRDIAQRPIDPTVSQSPASA
jgi:transcriptional regulator with XRE-family HTH domain